jgi:16S rRNA (uracil1498-N3)-methyltransferase
MKLHRFYLPNNDLTHDFWMKDNVLFHQWTRVLRFYEGREVVLFNDKREERLYKIAQIGDDAIHLELVTELEPKLPKTDIYLCFSLLKKDKNDWVLQKATELGVSHFVPLLCDRTEKTGFDVDRAKKIVIEASEQCGRTDIPRIREPITPDKIIDELTNKVDIYVAEQGSPNLQSTNSNPQSKNSIAVLVGPEGGWTDEEKELFRDKEVKSLAISEFTLRAETAAISVIGMMLL